MQCYPDEVKPAQRIIADWMERTRQAKGYSWPQWAKAAGIKAATTLTRAVKEDYPSVTSFETVDALAKAAEVPSPLDFLAGSIPKPQPTLNAAGMKALLADLLPLGPKGGWTAQDVEGLVAAIEYGLGIATTDPAKPASPDAFVVAARAAADRFRERGGTA